MEVLDAVRAVRQPVHLMVFDDQIVAVRPAAKDVVDRHAQAWANEWLEDHAPRHVTLRQRIGALLPRRAR
jgi:hypothetical protein